MARQPRMPAEAAVQFQEGINIVLSRWTALQMAVQNNWGGPHSNQKPLQISAQLFSLFTQSREKVYIDDVESMLHDSILSLNTEAGDGSVEEIAENLMIMHEECLEGNYNSIKSLREADLTRSVPTYIQQDDSDDDADDSSDDEMLSNDDSSSMVVDAPETSSRRFQEVKQDSPQTDDGWTVVGGSRRNKGKRN